MSNVLQFKKGASLPHHRKTDIQLVVPVPKTHNEIFEEIQESLQSKWFEHANSNLLNKFITRHIPKHAVGVKNSDYVNNIFDVSLVEQKLNINPIIFSPSSSVNNPDGWMVASTIGEQMIFTPNDMQSEASARSFHLLIFILFTYSTQT